MQWPRWAARYVAACDPFEDICKSPFLWILLMAICGYPAAMSIAPGADWTKTTWYGRILCAPAAFVGQRLDEPTRKWWHENAAKQLSQRETGETPAVWFARLYYALLFGGIALFFGGVWFLIRRLHPVLEDAARPHLRKELRAFYEPVRSGLRSRNNFF